MDVGVVFYLYLYFLFYFITLLGKSVMRKYSPVVPLQCRTF